MNICLTITAYKWNRVTEQKQRSLLLILEIVVSGIYNSFAIMWTLLYNLRTRHFLFPKWTFGNK